MTPAHLRILPPVVAGAVLLTVGVAALAPALLAPGDPNAIAPLEAFRPPLTPGHPFGTDESGRDLYRRIVHGAGHSLEIGIGATVISVGLGGVIGTAAALGGRPADAVLGRVIEVAFAFPVVLLALLFTVLSGPSGATAAWAVGLAAAPGYARMVRGEIRRIARTDYVAAERILGRSPAGVLGCVILPNAAGTLFALATLSLGQAIVWASALSFLDLGVRPPAPEWGSMLAAGRNYLSGTGWWMTVVPATVIVLVALAATVLGRDLERRRMRA